MYIVCLKDRFGDYIEGKKYSVIETVSKGEHLLCKVRNKQGLVECVSLSDSTIRFLVVAG